MLTQPRAKFEVACHRVFSTNAMQVLEGAHHAPQCRAVAYHRCTLHTINSRVSVSNLRFALAHSTCCALYCSVEYGHDTRVSRTRFLERTPATRCITWSVNSRLSAFHCVGWISSAMTPRDCFAAIFSTRSISVSVNCSSGMLPRSVGSLLYWPSACRQYGGSR